LLVATFSHLTDGTVCLACSGSSSSDHDESQYIAARTLVLDESTPSVARLARLLPCSYTVAAGLLRRMEAEGVIAQGSTRGLQPEGSSINEQILAELKGIHEILKRAEARGLPVVVLS